MGHCGTVHEVLGNTHVPHWRAQVQVLPPPPIQLPCSCAPRKRVCLGALPPRRMPGLEPGCSSHLGSQQGTESLHVFAFQIKIINIKGEMGGGNSIYPGCIKRWRRRAQSPEPRAWHVNAIDPVSYSVPGSTALWRLKASHPQALPWCSLPPLPGNQHRPSQRSDPWLALALRACTTNTNSPARMRPPRLLRRPGWAWGGPPVIILAPSGQLMPTQCASVYPFHRISLKCSKKEVVQASSPEGLCWILCHKVSLPRPRVGTCIWLLELWLSSCWKWPSPVCFRG